MQVNIQRAIAIFESGFSLHVSRLRAVTLLLTLMLLLLNGGTALADHLAISQLISSASEYDYPPYSVVTPDNEADGFSVELLRAALRVMDLDVTFQVGPWNEVKRLLADGKIQVLPVVGRTPERERDFDFTFPYLKMHGTIVVRKDEAGIHGLTDLKGKQLAVLKGDNAEEFLRRSNLGATLVTTATFEAALRQLNSGEHDAVVVQKLVALQLMRKHNLTNLKSVGPPLEDFVQSFCFAVKKGEHKLLTLLNEGLSIVIADGTFNRLHKKWFGPIEAFDLEKSRIVVGGDDDYPPYEFLDENGQPAGYNVDLTRAIAKQMGIEVDIQLRPWSQIRAGLANNEIDAVQGLFYSPERDANFDFSPAHTLLSHVIVVREGSEIPQTMADLAGKSILVMDGDIMHDDAVKFGYAEQLVLVASQEEALKQLADGRYDSALVAKIPALYWIKKHGWKNLRLGEKPVLSPEYCYAVPHGNPVLISRLTEGLVVVKATGEYREIYSRWFGMYEKSEFGLWDALRYLLFILVPLIGGLIGSLLWSASLKRKVKRATVQLRASEGRFKALHDASFGGIIIHNKGVILDCNQGLSDMTDYSHEELVGMDGFKLIAPDSLELVLQNIKTGYTQRYEVAGVRKDGSVYPLAIRGKNVEYKGMEVRVIEFRDITELKQAAEQLVSLNSQLATKSKELEQVVHATTHDLRAPLVTIEGFSGLLGASLDKILAVLDMSKLSADLKEKIAPCIDDSRESREYISKSVAKMNSLLTGLSQVSNLGRVELNKEEIDMNLLIFHILAPFEFQRKDKGVKIEISELPACTGDPDQINQLFSNLIGNAFKYSAPERPGVVKVSGQKEGEKTVYCVEDNGLGISPESIEKIFGMFQQLNPAASGEGLGLSIVSKIAERHGGKVWVESVFGEGSKFFVSL